MITPCEIEFRGSVLEVSAAHDVVAFEHRARFVPSERHGDTFGNWIAVSVAAIPEPQLGLTAAPALFLPPTLHILLGPTLRGRSYRRGYFGEIFQLIAEQDEALVLPTMPTVTISPFTLLLLLDVERRQESKSAED